MQIIFIGAGRLACNLAPALHEAGHQIVQVYSRTQASAESLASKVNASAVTNIDAVSREADVYIFSVTDTVLPALTELLSAHLNKNQQTSEAVFLHTAGSMPLSVFPQSLPHHGVIYPMQTLSKERSVDFSSIPFFVEGNDEHALSVAQQLATSVSTNVRKLSSEARRQLHLAAVFACNFANHCYQLSAEILAQNGLPFSVMLPLIDETAAKVHELDPLQAQTGPAVRYDERVIQSQLQLLADQPLKARVYELMSQSIHQSSQSNVRHD